MGACLVVLVAMTFNGYIIMVICLGGLFSHFFSMWNALALTFVSDNGPLCPAAAGKAGPTGRQFHEPRAEFGIAPPAS